MEQKDKCIFVILLGVLLLNIYGGPNLTRVMAADTREPFIVAVSNTPPKIDPHDAYDSTTLDVINQVCEGLYAPDYREDMSPVPRIASELGTWNDDLTELTIPLRDDVTFHDGTPLTAEAVVWNFDRLWDVANCSVSAHSRLWKNDQNQMIWQKCEALDDYTVKFTLYKPWTVFESLLAFNGASIIKPDSALEESFLNLTERLIGTGPFRLVELIPDNHTVFESYEQYYRGAPSIKTMIFQANHDTDSASEAFLNHETHFGGVASDYLDQAEADPAIEIQDIKDDAVFFMQFDLSLVSREVREAIVFAVNYPYLIELLNTSNDFYEMHQPIPDGMQYFAPLSQLSGLAEYDLTYARSILLNSDELGPICDSCNLSAGSSDAAWIAVAESEKPLIEMIFYHPYDPYISYLEPLGNQLQSDMKFLGFRLNLSLNFNIWNSEMANDNFGSALFFSGWGPDYNDPLNMIAPLYQTGGSYNHIGYTLGNSFWGYPKEWISDPEIDSCIQSAYQTIGEAREQLFVNIVDKLYTKGGLFPGFYLFQRGNRIMWNSRFIGNVDDNFNVLGRLYFYNCDWYSDYGLHITSAPLIWIILACCGTIFIVSRKFLHTSIKE